MIERSGTAAFDYDLHGGTDLTRIQWHFFGRSRLPVAVQTWELPPGGAEGMHAHPEEDPLEELYLVVDGSAVMRVDERTFEMQPGDAVLAPVGAEHDVRNSGESTLKLVVIWGRPAPTDWSSYGTAKAAREATARADG
ncbi:cupin domain-containing protein [Haloactinomyces albus]|uniref:Mannose-6-phosphate isomerase-like protein (Cupin superfamily) n=1 Tax=Haloactinomyces albus TaxID=1352928 RepID=A0AAE3ZAJ7_9ACTN|nr:cupin domain-containing protein [Haloactinomyces albus]MDR7300350.1 mannose-6-phosphate isomerase-like protein (cupin superfamily) [Haloactinomyces albus]